MKLIEDKIIDFPKLEGWKRKSRGGLLAKKRMLLLLYVKCSDFMRPDQNL